MSNPQTLKVAITSSLDRLPVRSLQALADFAEFLRAKELSAEPAQSIQLRGLWKDIEALSEEDIETARKDLWAQLDRREF